MSRFSGTLVVVGASIMLSTAVQAADKPSLTHIWRLYKDSWSGSCSGKRTHFMTISNSECNSAKGIGYVGSCSFGNMDAEHYVSSVSFPGSAKVDRLVKGGSCGCKDTFIYTPDSYWKNYFISNHGYSVESAYYAWPADIESQNNVNNWGLVPVYHAYSEEYCDNFYTEHPGQYDTKLATGKYGCGFETATGCVAYYAADGWLDLGIQCSVPNCSWKLTGPGGWSISGSGTYQSPTKKFPAHGYKLECYSMPGLITKQPTQTPYFPFFTSQSLLCEYECDNKCPYDGKAECFGNGYRVCQQNNYGCLDWSSTISCDDGDPCTQGDGCMGGNCVSGTPKNCSYLSDQCNNGICSGGACVATPKSGQCNDNDSCTTGDSCQGGQCLGTPKDCSYLTTDCMTGQCVAGNCIQQPKGGACNDGDACTIGDSCSGGQCVSGPVKDCTGLNDACNTGQCVNGSCLKQPKGGACNDGDPCTLGDACANGQCVSGPLKDCSPLTDACYDGVCVGGACQAVPKPGVDCNDNIACTNDSCNAAAGCVHESDHSLCNDLNPCTADECVPAAGGCTNLPLAADCDDGNGCTIADSCVNGSCAPGTPKNCDDGNVCTDDSCIPSTGQCVYNNNSDGCDDEASCTTDDVCAEGSCQGIPKDCDDGIECTQDECVDGAGCLNTPNDPACDDGNPCTGDVCNEATGCQNTPAGGPCSNGDPCTVNDQCVEGICVAGDLKDCNDDNVCTTDSCNPLTGECELAPHPGSCDDGLSCTVGDSCANGVCTSEPLPCDDGVTCTVDECVEGEGCAYLTQDNLCADGNPCTDDVCDDADGCLNTPNEEPCFDSDPCSEGDQCVEGVCVPGELKDCDDENSCTADSCSPDTGNCEHSPVEGDCDDGAPCTSGDICVDGLCKGVPTDECCDTDSDCPNPMPDCLEVKCIGGECKSSAFCPEGQCGPSPCDEGLDCGGCLVYEVCIGGWCRDECDLADKNLTKCTNDGKTLEKCLQDSESGLFYWKPTDCIALEEAGCAFSKDKGLFVCCSPDCSGKECGKPSACGMSCGVCESEDYCCEPGALCAEAEPADSFHCIDCCKGLECGQSTGEGCSKTCGTCGDGMTCKEGSCISSCEDAGVDEVGVCAGDVAWWCEVSMGEEVLQSVDCAEFVATCCFDPDLGRIGCCTCEDECEAKGWECGVNSCGLPCGDYDGECADGFSCVPETHQCLCHMPSLCYPDGGSATGDVISSTPDDSNPFLASNDGFVVADAPGGSSSKSAGCSNSPTAPFSGERACALLLLIAVGYLASLRFKERFWGQRRS